MGITLLLGGYLFILAICWLFVLPHHMTMISVHALFTCHSVFQVRIPALCGFAILCCSCWLLCSRSLSVYLQTHFLPLTLSCSWQGERCCALYVVTVSLSCMCTYSVGRYSELKSKLYGELCTCMCSVSLPLLHNLMFLLMFFLHFLTRSLTWTPLDVHDSCHVHNMLCDSLRFFLLWNMHVCAGCFAHVAIRNALDLLLAPLISCCAPCLSVINMFQEGQKHSCSRIHDKVDLSVFEFVVSSIQCFIPSMLISSSQHSWKLVSYVYVSFSNLSIGEWEM
jgi:hypothetical protein